MSYSYDATSGVCSIDMKEYLWVTTTDTVTCASQVDTAQTSHQLCVSFYFVPDSSGSVLGTGYLKGSVSGSLVQSPDPLGITYDYVCQPSAAPTVAPTLIPTVVPTLIPTVSPSVGPTVTPTHIPTVKPVLHATLQPTVGAAPICLR